MTLQEAVKAGKRVKRSYWPKFINLDQKGLTVIDALSEDWQVAPLPENCSHKQRYNAVLDQFENYCEYCEIKIKPCCWVPA